MVEFHARLTSSSVVVSDLHKFVTTMFLSFNWTSIFSWLSSRRPGNIQMMPKSLCLDKLLDWTMTWARIDGLQATFATQLQELIDHKGLRSDYLTVFIQNTWIVFYSLNMRIQVVITFSLYWLFDCVSQPYVRVNYEFWLRHLISPKIEAGYYKVL